MGFGGIERILSDFSIFSSNGVFGSVSGFFGFGLSIDVDFYFSKFKGLYYVICVNFFLLWK